MSGFQCSGEFHLDVFTCHSLMRHSRTIQMRIRQFSAMPTFPPTGDDQHLSNHIYICIQHGTLMGLSEESPSISSFIMGAATLVVAGTCRGPARSHLRWRTSGAGWRWTDTCTGGIGWWVGVDGWWGKINGRYPWMLNWIGHIYQSINHW